MPSNPRSIIHFSALLAAAVLFAAACGSDSASDAAGTEDSSSTLTSTETSSDESESGEATASDDGEQPSTPAAGGCPATDGSQAQQQSFSSPQPMCIDTTGSYTAEVVTNQGTITVELDAAKAPETVNNFVTLARYRYFDGTICHRIIPGFVVQCGDPTATGAGNPGYRFADELPAEGEYQLGSLAMANSGPDTNGSQFFIISGESGVALPPLYSLFGQVTDGFETTVVEIDQLGSGSGAPTTDVIIESVTIIEG